jgi:hypothetical protein
MALSVLLNGGPNAALLLILCLSIVLHGVAHYNQLQALSGKRLLKENTNKSILIFGIVSALFLFFLLFGSLLFLMIPAKDLEQIMVQAKAQLKGDAQSQFPLTAKNFKWSMIVLISITILAMVQVITGFVLLSKTKNINR